MRHICRRENGIIVKPSCIPSLRARPEGIKNPLCRSIGLSLILCLILLLSCGCSQSFVSTPDTSVNTRAPQEDLSSQGPFLRIEAGGHTAIIRRICPDASGRFLVTCSDDKTVRLWSLADGRPLSIIRVPLGKGNEGKIYAVALSPDGSIVAAGGWTGYAWEGSHSIYLFDRKSGVIIKRIKGLPNVIYHLAFSPDDNYLAASLGSNGIRVYRTKDWRLVGKDEDYGDSSLWVDFARDGRMVTTSYDGLIRLYDPNFMLILKKKAPGGKEPFAVAFSPDGKRIAVGFYNSTAVNVLSATDLTLIYAPDITGIDNGDMGSLAWSGDGRFLYAGGQYNKDDINPIRCWVKGGQGDFTDLPASTNTITDIRALTDGRVVYGAGGPVWGVFDSSGNKTLEHLPPVADFRDNLQGFLISHDGTTIRFGFKQWGEEPALFSVTERSLIPLSEEEKAESSGLAPPRTGTPGIEVTGWENTFSPQLNGKGLELDDYETSRSLVITPDGRHFLLGTEWNLRYFDNEGRQIWRKDAPGVAWGVNIAGNGRVAVAAFSDGTIRWYRLQNGRELMSFFPHPETGQWVLWTQEGFFDCSEGGEALIGYHINNGLDKAPDFIEVAQVYNLFYRPDLVAQALLPEGEQVLGGALRKIGDIRTVLAAGLPPRLELADPNDSEGTQEERDFTLVLNVTDQGGGIGRIVYRLNGVNVGQIEGRPAEPRRKGQMTIYRRPFTLGPGRNIIQATGINAKGEIESQPVTSVIYVREPVLQRPSLYVLAIGIDAYRDRDFQLKYAASDANAMARTIEQSGQGLFQEIRVRTLLNKEATLENITGAFRELADRVQGTDVFILYLSGHAIVLDGTYYFIPWEVVYKNDDVLRDMSLSHGRLVELLGMVPALKSLIILDTCYSGAVISKAGRGGLSQKTAIGRFMRATGRTLLASCSESQMAIEGHRGHGVFTYALLQGLNGEADRTGNNDMQIYINELIEYVDREVPRITMEKWGYEQFPMYDLKGQLFPIGLRRKSR